MLSQEQIKQIKSQLFKQIEKFPEQQREAARKQIEEMNTEELEEFLIKNNMIKDKEEQGDSQECIFCLILKGKMKAYRLDENKKALAILELNPLSPGHTIVISKEHNSLSNLAFSLANRIAKRIKSKLKPEEVKIENSKLMGHELINIIPIYKNQKLEKKKAEERELILLQEKLKAKQRQKKEKKIISQVQTLPQAPRRIP